jgi:ubiquinone biosynthesis protein
MAGLLDTVRDLDRLRQIVTVLVRHGFGEIVQRTGLGSLAPKPKTDEKQAKVSVGERIRLVVTDLGPSFIKLGQIVSTRPDVIPEDIIKELKKLQDEVPPVPFDQVRAALEQELGAPTGEVFESFDEKPLASASIAQVHRAKLRTADGVHEVVVKIQRPGIRSTIERDIDLLYWLAKALERSIPEARIYSPVRMVGEFERAITAELDFVLEADHAERFTQNFDGYPNVKFPRVYREPSSKRVLVLEYLPGLKVYDAVRDGASGERITKLAMNIIVKQIFEDGFFHADPHPGNVLILGGAADPTIAMIDLGLVGRLTPKLRDKTIDLMVASVRKDYKAIADALYALGHPTKKIDRDAYEAEVASLADKYLGKKLKDIELSAMIRDLVYGATKYGIEIPPDFLMVGKALMTVEGVGKEIHPDLDFYEELQPYFVKLLAQRYSPEKVSQDAIRTLSRLGNAASEMPSQLQEILDDLRRGRLGLQVQELTLRDATDHLGRRLYSGLVVSALVVSSGMLFATDHWAIGSLSLLSALGWGAAHFVRLWWLRRKERKAARAAAR